MYIVYLILSNLCTLLLVNILHVHCVLDIALMYDYTGKLCFVSTNPAKAPSETHHSTRLLPNGSVAKSDSSAGAVSEPTWRPVLIFIPLRLGLNEINAVYIQRLKRCFTLSQSLGVIGGKPNHAHYFIGFVGK